MIDLTVISLNGVAVSIPTVSFDEIGGTIGRAETNQLVLPDTDRMVSRVHAQLVYRSGRFNLIDRGSNAVLHNGQAVGNGREVTLASGDRIEISGYLIQVSSGAPPKADDPFADFDNFLLDEKASTTAPIAVPSRANPVSAAPAPKAASPALAQPAPGARPAVGIPDDWDPFADDTSAPAIFPAQEKARSKDLGDVDFDIGMPDPLSFTAHASGEPSLDDLFGLNSKSPGSDPFAGSSLSGPKAMPNTSGDVDPLRALQMAPAPASATPESDHVSDLRAPWTTPQLSPKPAPLSAIPLAGAVLSWQTDAAPPVPVPVPVQERTAPLRPAPNTAVKPELPAAPAQSRANPALAPEPVADSNELLLAFLRGLGVPDLRLRPVTPEAMFLLGQTLREAAKGTVDLLAARNALKKEVHAEVTVVTSSANNPLKFSPSVDFALQSLLGPATSGFMGPVDSMRDAFDSLKTHQMGVMAGMKAALTDVIRRFEPGTLEAQLAARGARSSLISSLNKARLWELFQETYGQLARDAEVDLDELLRNAFGREYERFVDELHDPGKTP